MTPEVVYLYNIIALTNLQQISKKNIEDC